jgi:hypothetical protein
LDKLLGGLQQEATGMPGRWDGERRWIALAVVICGILFGCNKPSPPTSLTSTGASPAPPFARSSSDVFDHDDPCSLLDPKEVEAVLGASLAAPPYRSYNGPYGPTADGSTCIYETANFRFISLEVTFSGGAQAYSMFGMVKNLLKSAGNAQIANNVKKNFKLDDGTEIAGEWDEATLVAMNCCIFAGLRGDQLITIDFTATPATLRQAASLVDTAYKRIDHPLKIDGGAAVNAAKALDKTRPKPVDACSLLTRAEVEAIIGTLSANPSAAGQSGCNFALPQRDNTHPQYEIQIYWSGGYSRWRSDHHVAGIGMDAVNQNVTDFLGGHPLPAMPTGAADASIAAGGAKAANGGDPAEAIGRGTINGFTVVKRDVLLNVTGLFSDPAKEKALLAAVAQKI